ncbi:MAG: ABC transporter permease [Desulfamplus sp.]|nr:ABC transporter permease [Desulfamplus sp.]
MGNRSGQIWLRLAIRELKKDKGFSFFFILNLAIGLVGFIALNSFNNSLQNHLKDNLKEILTADMVITSPRALNDKEKELIRSVVGNDKKESQQISFFSMISGEETSKSANTTSKLANIIAIDNSFPLYGEMISEINKKQLYLQQGSLKVWITPDIAVSMNLQVGSKIKIGDRAFFVDNIVSPPPDASVTSFQLAPKIYIALDDAEKTGLLKFGSRVSFKRYYRFPYKTDISSKTVELRKKIDTLFKGAPIISVYDSEDVNQNLNKIFGYFTGYMGLIGVVALFLAGIGTAYLFRGYLNTKIKEIAILMTLGASRVDAYLMFMFQVIILGAISTIVAVILSIFILPLFPEVLQGLIPKNFNANADIKSIITAFIPGIFGSIIFCLPVFATVYQLKPVILLQGAKHFEYINKVEIIGFRLFLSKLMPRLLSFVPAILTFWFLSAYQTRSFERGTIFFIGSLCVMATFTTIGWLSLKLLKKLSLTKQFIRKIAFRNLYRNQIASISCFVTIAMGAFLINVIPQIKNGIQDEISQPKGIKIPGFFLIDIQPEQLDGLKKFLESKSYFLTNVSPIIRGRILTVNGKGFYERLDKELSKKDREETSLRGEYRRREFNFSYRESLDKSEKIVKGTPLSQISWGSQNNEPLTNSTQYQSQLDKFMEISIEEGFADRFDIKIGDIMAFDIQGVEFEGKVVNLRKVRWNSFQPNFFILFQKGVLDDAPKTFLASIPQMKPSEKSALQNSLVREFPNISVVDVNQTVNQILTITDRLSFSINFMATLAIVAGLVVLFSIARYETHARSWEINLLKVLGAGFKDIREIILFEFGFLGFMAALFATFLSLMVSYLIAWFFFERLWSFRWEYSLFCLIAITLICIGTSLAATGKVVKQKAVELLS